jgi:hypothetical protein
MSTSTQPWKTRREIPDMQVLDAAEQYDDARQLLERQPLGSGVLLPQMNAAAIAVELFLKSLSTKSIFVQQTDFDGCIVHAKPDVPNHHLVELFDNVPDDIRDDLELRFKTSELTRFATCLRDLLATYEGLFTASRYPFEPKRDVLQYPFTARDIRDYPLDPLMELSAFLRTFIAGLTPVDRIEW